MAFTDNDASIINTSLNTLANTASIVAQGKTNKKTRQWNEKMYGLQRADSLSDWTMQNEYNSPQSQMARLREAGLNPNLVYGKGADNTSASVRSSSAGSWSPKAPDFAPLGNSLMTYIDVQMKEAQIDNLKVANTVALQEAALKAATTANVAQQTETGKFNLGLSEDLRSNSLDMARESLRKLQIGVDIDLQENERKAALNSANLLTAAENVLNLRATRANTQADAQRIQEQIRNLKSDAKLKELDIELRHNGIQPTDNLFMRILGRILGKQDIKDIRIPEFKNPTEGKKYDVFKGFGKQKDY